VIEDFQTTSSSAWIHRKNLRTLLTMTNGSAKFAPHSVGWRRKPRGKLPPKTCTGFSAFH